MKVISFAALICAFAIAAVADGNARMLLAELEKRLDAIETECLKAGRQLGEPDAHGEFVLSEDGKKAEAVRKEIEALLVANPELAKDTERDKWGLQPLGAPGTLSLPTEFVNKPVFKKPAPFRPGLVLAENGRVCAIYAPKGNKRLWALAEEMAWHLGEMAGRTFEVRDGGSVPAGVAPVVLFADDANTPVSMEHIRGEASLVKRIGDTLLVAGRGSGTSHALTYVLESLGCRYLWPGESGKIIPKKSRIVLPADIDIEFTPKFRIRGVRDGGSMSDRMRYSFRRLGFVPEVAYARHRRVLTDRRRPENRGFWQWHGVNDTVDVAGYSDSPGAYVWGHYFGDYVKRYWKDHPEWFALQRNGKRDMSNVGERPTFCLSNRELAKEAARDIVEKFRARPKMAALSACLPDGGPTSQCLCPECRRLDPVNAPPSMICGHPYVSRTDRAFTFANRIAEGVTAVLPGKRLTFYAYCDYEKPPVAVKPHPALILFNVAGEYTVGRARAASHRTLAAWSSFGNEMFWRPNVLRGYGVEVPFDFSRDVFEDTELCKANNFIGTDFDCMGNQWAIKGLMCYMTAKGLMNPSRLSYDDLLDDYCRAGFGRAAGDIKAYFAYLAKISREVASDNLDYRGSGGKYMAVFDVARANALLDRAAASAGDDAAAQRRIRFLRIGVRYAEHDKTCAEAAAKRDRRLIDRQRDYLKFVHDMYADDDALVAVSLDLFGFYNAPIRGALNELEKKPRKGGAVERLSPSQDGRDRTADVNAALDRIRLAGGGALELEKGTYRFDPASATPLKFWISNHDQRDARPVLFPLWGMSNVTIRANGSLLLCDSPLVAFAVKDAANVALEGFRLDNARPAMTEARIVRFSDGGRPVVRIDAAKCPASVEDGKLVVAGPHWRNVSSSLMVFGAADRAILAGTGDIGFAGARDLGGGDFLLDVNLRRAAPAAKPGDVAVLRPRFRPAPAIFAEGVSGLSLRDVVVHDAHGMALVAQYSSDVSWKGSGSAESGRSGVYPSKGRVSSIHADATHFSNVKGLVEVENGLFEGMMDDAINVHSTCLKIEKSGGGNEIVCKYMHFQAVGFDVFKPGDHVRFVRGRTLEDGDQLRTVVSARRLAYNKVALTLDGPVPDGFGESDAVENADYQPSVVFRGNLVRRNRARGALFTTTQPVRVEGNVFERVSGSAILFAGDASKWYETGACRDVEIRGNVFSNCCASAKCHGYCGGVVSIWPTVAPGSRTPYHRNVSVVGNEFHSFDVPLLYAVAASNVVFSGNSVRRNSEYPGWGKGDFDVDHCQDTRIEPPVCMSAP